MRFLKNPDARVRSHYTTGYQQSKVFGRTGYRKQRAVNQPGSDFSGAYAQCLSDQYNRVWSNDVTDEVIQMQKVLSGARNYRLLHPDRMMMLFRAEYKHNDSIVHAASMGVATHQLGSYVVRRSEKFSERFFNALVTDDKRYKDLRCSECGCNLHSGNKWAILDMRLHGVMIATLACMKDECEENWRATIYAANTF